MLSRSAPASELNAQQLADMKLVYGENWVESEAEYVAKARAMLDESRASTQFDDDDFLRISAVARELGNAEWFGRYNKIFSKYVHATAFSMLSFPTEKARTDTSSLMLYHGTQSCLKVLYAVNDFLKQHTFARSSSL